MDKFVGDQCQVEPGLVFLVSLLHRQSICGHGYSTNYNGLALEIFDQCLGIMLGCMRDLLWHDPCRCVEQKWRLAELVVGLSSQSKANRR